ncbi:g11763 [Coccomyxa viridis]|uniref:G11763 protein n=1 Tax=Coccomyxa viridis TaxID=1274662 RepID=A0ABP1GBB9_9CHLO
MLPIQDTQGYSRTFYSSEDLPLSRHCVGEMVVIRALLLCTFCSLLLGVASLPFTRASLGETGGLEGSTNTSDMTAIMLESAFSETSMHDSLAVKNESNHGSPLEEVIVAPNSTAQGLIPADVELLKTVVDVLGAYAHKYNIGTEITIGAQPARDLTVATPKVTNHGGSR